MPKFMGMMNRVTRCLATYRSRRFDGDLGSGHHSLALVLCRHPGCTQETLAELVCLDKSTVTRALTTMENSGYVTRTPNPEDKRQLLVEPTEKLKTVLPRLEAIMDEWYSRLSDGISEEEMLRFASVLHRIEQNARSIAYETEVNDP